MLITSKDTEEIEKFLLSREDWVQKHKELEEKGWVYPLYTYKVSGNNQELVFFGAKHSFDANNPQFKFLKKEWEIFLRQTGGKNCIVLVEGGKRPVMQSEKEAVENYGEAGFITYLAAKEGIERYSPEPSMKFEVLEILQSFPRERVIYYYFARTVSQWHRLVKKEEPEEYIKPFIDRYKKIKGLEDFDFSIDNFIRIHDATHNHKFDLDNQKCFYEDSNPFKSGVAEAVTKLRDVYIVGEIKRLWNQGKNIFIVYGASHAIRQEKALKNLLN